MNAPVVLELGIGTVMAAMGVLAAMNFGLIKFFAKRELKRLSELENKFASLQASVISRPEMDRISQKLTDLVKTESRAQTAELREVRSRLDQLMIKMME